MSTKLPGIPTLRTNDRALSSWAQAVTEHLEVRDGKRDPLERSAVQGDLVEMAAVVKKISTPARDQKPGDIAVQIGGLPASIAIDNMVDSLLGNARFKKALGASDSASTPDAGSGEDASPASSELRASITALESRVSDTSRVANDAASDARTARALAAQMVSGGRGPLLYCGDLAVSYTFLAVARWAIWSISGSAPGVDITKDDHIVDGDTVALRVLDGAGLATGATVVKRFMGGAWLDIGAFINGVSIADATIPQAKMELPAARRLDEALGVMPAGIGTNSNKLFLKVEVLLGNDVNAFTLQTLLLDLYERLVAGTKPNRFHDDTILFNGLTTRQIIEYIWARIPINPL